MAQIARKKILDSEDWAVDGRLRGWPRDRPGRIRRIKLSSARSGRVGARNPCPWYSMSDIRALISQEVAEVVR